MSLTSKSLKATIEKELAIQGFKLDTEGAMIAKLAEAIANAVITEITTNAEVVVAPGVAGGTFPVL